MSGHALAIVFFSALVFQIGCTLGVEKDQRPWTAARYGSLTGSVLVLAAAVWLAVNAL